jgi:broad specificity phosphatase PhoE
MMSEKIADSGAEARKVILIRHPKVIAPMHGVCYGQGDVELATGWEDSLMESLSVVRSLSEREKPTVIWHSDLQRAARPAQWIARQLGIVTNATVDLRERNFGTWQMKPWDEIPQEEVLRCHEMLESPETYRPGGGETTSEVQRRACRWLSSLLEHDKTSATVVAVAHSGSITAIAGAIHKIPPLQWTPYYLKPSKCLVLDAVSLECVP